MKQPLSIYFPISQKVRNNRLKSAHGSSELDLWINSLFNEGSDVYVTSGNCPAFRNQFPDQRGNNISCSPQESVTIKAREYVGVDDGEWELTRKSCNAIENSLLEGVAGSVDLLTFCERLSLAGLYKLGLLITKTNTRSKGENKVIKSRSTIVVDHSLVTGSVYFFTSPFVQIKSLNDHEGNLAIVYQSERLASADVRGLKIANELVTTVHSWLSPEIPLLTFSVQSRCVLRKDTVLKSVVRGDILVCACHLQNSEVFSYHWQDQTHISSRHGMLIHILCEPIMLLGNISS